MKKGYVKIDSETGQFKLRADNGEFLGMVVTKAELKKLADDNGIEIDNMRFTVEDLKDLKGV